MDKVLAHVHHEFFSLDIHPMKIGNGTGAPCRLLAHLDHLAPTLHTDMWLSFSVVFDHSSHVFLNWFFFCLEIEDLYSDQTNCSRMFLHSIEKSFYGSSSHASFYWNHLRTIRNAFFIVSCVSPQVNIVCWRSPLPHKHGEKKRRKKRHQNVLIRKVKEKKRRNENALSFFMQRFLSSFRHRQYLDQIDYVDHSV